MNTATVIKMSIQRMVCTGCGAEANASCNCGKPYVPKAVRVRDAIEADPTKPNKQIARETGADPKQVRRERTKQRGGHVPPAEDEMPTEEEAEESYQETLYDQVCLFLERMTDETRQRFFAHIKRVYK